MGGEQEAAPSRTLGLASTMLSWVAVELSKRGCAGGDAGIRLRAMTGVKILKGDEKVP